jgi:membrane protein implicated in regulation of membrane protease activity
MTDLALSPWHLWLILAALLLTAEIFTSGFVLAGLGFGAVVASATHYFTGSAVWALAAFCMGSLVFFAGIRPLALRTFMEAKPSPFGVNAMVGERIVVSDERGEDGRLQTIFRDSRWSISSAEPLAPGDAAEIVDVDSTTLVVKRV